MIPEIVARDADNDKIPVHGNGGIYWVMLIYFCSGTCSLIDEVVWVRLLKLTLGNTVYASTIVVSMFMAGLALGSFIMGRFAGKVKRRLRLYAILEICITISALSLPWLLKLMDKVYQWFYLSYHPSPTALLLLQVTVSACLLLAPAMLMGSTLPLLSRYVTALEEKAGQLVGRLYALNTLGATLGCFLAGFLLIRVVGVMGTLYLAAGINLLVAIFGWLLSLSHDKAPTSDVKIDRTQPNQATRKLGYVARSLLLLAVFASGFISIGYELLWMRSITYQLQSFAYVFSAVLTVYLLGNVVGAWIGSHLSKRLKNPSLGFGFSITCLGLLGILFVPSISVWYEHMPSEANSLFEGIWKLPIIRAAVVPLLHSLSLFFIPSIVMGIGFPLAIQTWNNHKRKVGQTTGTIYGTNTIGAVLGGIVTGFVLIPVFGSQMSIIVLGIAGICIGTFVVLVVVKKNILIQRFAYLVIAALLVIVGIAMPSELMNNSLIGISNTRTIAVQESVTTTASVHESIEQEKIRLWLGTSNQLIGSDWKHRSAQKMLGHLGVFLNRHTKSVLSIGFGTGETTACLAKHTLDRIDCVEIAPELVDMAIKYFDHINLGDQLNQKVNMIHMDAKNYLHLSPDKYDVIINGANLPYESGSAPMFAKEHFQNALDHLNDGGLFLTKLHLNTSKSVFNSTLGTFLEVFPRVTIWFPVTRPISCFYLVGSQKKQYFSPKYIEKELRNEAVKNSVSYLHFRNSIDVLSDYIGDETDIGTYLRDYHVNSDYSPYIEFNLDEKEFLHTTDFFENLLRNIRVSSLVPHINWSGMSPDERSKWLEDYRQSYDALHYLLMAKYKKNPFESLDINSRGLHFIPTHPALLHQQEEKLEEIEALFRSGWAGGDRFLSALDRDLQSRPLSDPQIGPLWLIRSWSFIQERQTDRALYAAQQAVLYYPNSKMTQKNLGELYLQKGLAEKAITHLEKALQFDLVSPVLHFDMGKALAYQGKVRNAVTSYQEALRLNPHFDRARTALNKLLE